MAPGENPESSKLAAINGGQKTLKRLPRCSLPKSKTWMIALWISSPFFFSLASSSVIQVIFWVTHLASAARQPINTHLFNRNHLSQLQLKTGCPSLLSGTPKCGVVWWQWFHAMVPCNGSTMVAACIWQSSSASGHFPPPLVGSSSVTFHTFPGSQLGCRPAFDPLPRTNQ